MNATRTVAAMRLTLVIAVLLSALVTKTSYSCSAERFSISGARRASMKHVTVQDISALRYVDSLSISPDGRYFAIFVRQGDPALNKYCTGWFIGSTAGGLLRPAGDGGDVEPGIFPNGQQDGPIAGRESIWSPDGRWIAYQLQRDGQLQLWRSRVSDGRQEQLTHNTADVRRFVWSKDGQEIYYATGMPRHELAALREQRAREGHRYNEDLSSFLDLMDPQSRFPDSDAEFVWRVRTHDRREERDDGSAARALNAAPNDLQDSAKSEPLETRAPPRPLALRSDGARAWLEPLAAASARTRLVFSMGATEQPRVCTAAACTGVISGVRWSSRGDRILFWRNEGISYRAWGFGAGFYSLSPATGEITTIVLAPYESFQLCQLAADDQMICVHETPTRPSHIVAIDLGVSAPAADGSRVPREIVDLNPEFGNIQLGRVERFEWDLPRFSWNEPNGELAGLYDKRTYGYIFYPPNFDPTKKYPVFIEPYVAGGFSHPAHAEHALHVYAANGIVVLNLTFPYETFDVVERLGTATMSQLYSARLDFPLLSMLSASTFRALDVVSERGFVDETRVGIGGVSHGSLVPLYMVQKQDRLAALSVSSPNFDAISYYWATPRFRKYLAGTGYENWEPRPEGDGQEFWRRISVADHVDAIEAPILFQLTAKETFGLLRLLRRMEDSDKPYDAYIFPNETHIKWQPAHLETIMNRNLDWFRFWLQGIEDADPSKSQQYDTWHVLRDKLRGTHTSAR